MQDCSRSSQHFRMTLADLDFGIVMAWRCNGTRDNGLVCHGRPRTLLVTVRTDPWLCMSFTL